jgi:hypothetical protein
LGWILPAGFLYYISLSVKIRTDHVFIRCRPINTRRIPYDLKVDFEAQT